MDVCFIHDIDVFTRGADQPSAFRAAMDGCFRALERLRGEGILKAIGIGVNEWQVCERALRERDFDCFLLAGQYSLLEQESLDSFLPLCVERNVAVVIGGGFNSGILATGAIEGARYNYGPAPAHIVDRVRGIEAICREHNVSISAAAMQFVTAHPAVSSLVVGARSPAQMIANVRSFEAHIPHEFWAAMRNAGFIRTDAPSP